MQLTQPILILGGLIIILLAYAGYKFGERYQFTFSAVPEVMAISSLIIISIGSRPNIHPLINLLCLGVAAFTLPAAGSGLYYRIVAPAAHAELVAALKASKKQSWDETI